MSSSNTGESITDKISNAASYVTESVQGALSGASAEKNKAVAKDSNASLGDRAKAGMDFMSDKAEQKGHDAKAEGHKEASKH